MVSKESLEEYRQLYKQKFGKDISAKKASDEASKLVSFFKLLLDIDRRNKRAAKEAEYVFDSLLEEVSDQFRLKPQSIHGVSHWQSVKKISLELASLNGADHLVVGLFSLLHDSQRENEDNDPDHGPRASIYTQALFNRGLLPIGNDQLKNLLYACKHHSNKQAKGDSVTVQTCWDSDRLDLVRVGKVPDPKFLYTEAAKRYKT